MKVEYRKDLHHNYMIITKEELHKEEPYCLRILKEERIEGILSLEQRQMDDRQLYYYEITGKQSVSSLLDKSSLSGEKVILLMKGILQALETAYEYLLPEGDFVLAPEFIYLDVIRYTPSLCFLSGYQSNIKVQLNSLLEYLMNKVDYKDKEAVMLVYQLYAASREESFTILQLHDVIDKHALPLPQKKNQSTRLFQEEVEVHKEQKKAIAPRSERSLSMEQIPVMMEKLEREEEELYYPLSTFLLTTCCIVAGILVLILCYITGIIYDSFGSRVDYYKLCGVLLILLCSEGYLMKRIWDKNNRISRIVSKSEYIDPRTEPDYSGINLGRAKALFPSSQSVKLTTGEEKESSAIKEESFYDKTEAYIEENKASELEDGSKTRLLSDILYDQVEAKLYLKPVNEGNGKPILLKEFPFFIGKLKSDVDYYLEKSVISRYHAKITKEEDNYYITDLNSTNGTYVNGLSLQTYERKEIKLGDEVAFADIKYRFFACQQMP